MIVYLVKSGNLLNNYLNYVLCIHDTLFNFQHGLDKSAKRKSTCTDEYRYMQPGGVKH